MTVRELTFLAGAVELLLVLICVALGYLLERRSHFWARAVLGCLALPLSVLCLGALLPDHVASRIVGPLILLALIAVPGAAYRMRARPLGPPGHGGDGGSGPDRPPDTPEPPLRGVPVPRADLWPRRRRDHIGPMIPRAKRRREREPAPPRPIQ